MPDLDRLAIMAQQPPIRIPFPTPAMEDPFWSPPPAPVCVCAGVACKWAGLCSTPRQTVNHQAGLFEATCANYILLEARDADWRARFGPVLSQ